VQNGSNNNCLEHNVNFLRRVYRKQPVLLRADLDGTIFPYDCSMRLAHVMSTTRIVSSKSDLPHLHNSRTQH